MKLPFSFLQTPLYLAVVANQPQMVSMFVQRNANPNSMAQVSCLGCFINARNLVQHSQSEIWFSSPLQKYSSSLTTRILFTFHLLVRLIPRLHPSSRILVCICLPPPAFNTSLPSSRILVHFSLPRPKVFNVWFDSCPS